MKFQSIIGGSGQTVRVEKRQLGATAPWSITLPKPPSVNEMYGQAPGHKRFHTARYKEWLKLADERMARATPPIYAGEVHVAIIIEDAGGGDLDNRIKALLDLLVRHHVIKDDGRRYVRSIEIAWGNVPGARITIQPLIAPTPTILQLVKAA